MSPAVRADTARVGTQWRPRASCVGNSQMSFWSLRKPPGRVRQVASRSDGEEGVCRSGSDAGSPYAGAGAGLSGRFAVATGEGLSGRAAAVAWAQAGMEQQPMAVTEAKISNPNREGIFIGLLRCGMVEFWKLGGRNWRGLGNRREVVG